MALDNYANLKQSIKKWSHREDIDEFVEDCITMAEQEMFYGQSPLRLPDMITETIEANEDKTLAFPDDMLELLALHIEVDEVYYQLKVIPENLLPDTDEEGTPVAYCMSSEFKFDITPDQEYNFKIVYYQKPAALSDDNATNIIIDSYPTAYLFGGMSAAFMYAGEEDKADRYALRMRDVINRANTEASNKMYGASPDQIIVGSVGNQAPLYGTYRNRW